MSAMLVVGLASATLVGAGGLATGDCAMVAGGALLGLRLAALDLDRRAPLRPLDGYVRCVTRGVLAWIGAIALLSLAVTLAVVTGFADCVDWAAGRIVLAVLAASVVVAQPIRDGAMAELAVWLAFGGSVAALGPITEVGLVWVTGLPLIVGAVAAAVHGWRWLYVSADMFAQAARR